MGKTSMARYKKDSVILRQGETKKELYKVLSGKVALYVNYGSSEQLLAATLATPECFGEVMLIAGQPSHYSAVALEDSVVLHVPEDSFDGFLKNDNHSAASVMQSMARGVALMNNMLGEVKSRSAAGRMDGAAFKELAAKYAARYAELVSPPAPAPQPQPAAPAPQPAMARPAAAPAPQPAMARPAAAPAPQPAMARPAAAPAPQPAAAAAVQDDGGPFLPGHGSYPGITHPEYRNYVFNKEYTCPHCKKAFTDVKIFYSSPRLSTIQHPDASRYDLRTFYKDFEVEWYEIITCPHCLFSALDSVFIGASLRNGIHYEHKLQQVKKAVRLDFGAERDLNFVFSQHYLALACSHAFQDYRQLDAHLWLNLRWLYKSAHDEPLARLAEQRAMEAYRQVYIECKLSPAQEQRVCLLLAGMYYRAGDWQGAREWALNVRENRDGKLAFSNLAKQLIDDVREQIELAKQKAGQ